MEHLIFVVWMLLFPLTTALTSYFSTLRYKGIEGVKLTRKDLDYTLSTSIYGLAIYFTVAYLLY